MACADTQQNMCNPLRFCLLMTLLLLCTHQTSPFYNTVMQKSLFHIDLGYKSVRSWDASIQERSKRDRMDDGGSKRDMKRSQYRSSGSVRKHNNQTLLAPEVTHRLFTFQRQCLLIESKVFHSIHSSRSYPLKSFVNKPYNFLRRISIQKLLQNAWQN